MNRQNYRFCCTFCHVNFFSLDIYFLILSYFFFFLLYIYFLFLYIFTFFLTFIFFLLFLSYFLPFIQMCLFWCVWFYLKIFIAKIGCYEATVKLANWPMKDVLISGRCVLIKGVTYSNTLHTYSISKGTHNLEDVAKQYQTQNVQWLKLASLSIADELLFACLKMFRQMCETTTWFLHNHHLNVFRKYYDGVFTCDCVATHSSRLR